MITPNGWKEHYPKLLQENQPECDQEEKVTARSSEAEITEGYINKAENNKPPGPVNIKMELLKLEKNLKKEKNFRANGTCLIGMSYI